MAFGSSPCHRRSILSVASEVRRPQEKHSENVRLTLGHGMRVHFSLGPAGSQHLYTCLGQRRHEELCGVVGLVKGQKAQPEAFRGC